MYSILTKYLKYACIYERITWKIYFRTITYINNQFIMSNAKILHL